MICVIGNKADQNERREVTTQDAEAYTTKVGALFYLETSALTGQGNNTNTQQMLTLIDIVLYSSIYIAPLNSHGQTEALLVRLEKRQVLRSGKDLERSDDKREARTEGGRPVLSNLFDPACRTSGRCKAIPNFNDNIISLI